MHDLLLRLKNLPASCFLLPATCEPATCEPAAREMMNVDMGGGFGPGGGFGSGGKPRSRRKKKGGRPVAVVCYICGRQYGRSSLGIHLKQCKDLWEKREALKPRHERKPVPRAPANFERAIATGDLEYMSDEAIHKANSAAFDSYNNEALDPCPHCGRTMLPKALEIHLRSCRPDRLIGTKLKAHSGKAGGNLGQKGNPHEIARRPGTAPRTVGSVGRRGTPNSSRERLSVRDRLEARRTDSGSGLKGRNSKGGFDFDNVVVKEPSSSPRASSSSPPYNTSSATPSSSYSPSNPSTSTSRFAKSAARHLSMESSATKSKESSASSADSSEAWHEAFDPKSGRNFYYNARGETRWTLPGKSMRTNSSSDKKSSPPSPDVLSRDIAERSRSSFLSARKDTPTNESPRDLPPRAANGDSKRISNLENKVARLEEQLSHATSEIARLNKMMNKFQAVFAASD